MNSPIDADKDATPSADTPTAAADRIDLQPILASVGEAAYHWTLDDDAIVWSDNAAVVVGADDIASIATGRLYAALLAPESETNRFDAVTASQERDHGGGVAYRIQYCLKSAVDESKHWIEDSGVWFAGRNGRPERAAGVIRAINDRHAEEQRLDYLSRHDSLTGQLNRIQMLEHLRLAIEEARDERLSCAFLIAGIDNLALVNDTYGFEVADHVIAQVGRRLAKRLRGGDSIGRLSGNKFGLVLRNCSDDDMDIAAKRLLAAIHDKVVATELGSVSVTISIGGVAVPKYAATSSQAVARAHEALDRQRRRRSNTFTIYQPSAKRDDLRRRNIRVADAIIRGLNERKFHFAYQPIVAADTGATAYHECLLRLDKPGGAGESGGKLVAIAERLGLIRLIDHRVLDLAFEVLDTHPDARLSINVSAECVAEAAWMSKLIAGLARRPQAASRMVVELTETAVVRNLADATLFIRRLRELGLKTAIDDFGAGYTSFQALKDLAVDLVKIDGAFIASLASNKDDEVFVRALVDIAKVLGLETVAEWVGDAETVAILRAMGVDYFQGEYFGLATAASPWVDGDSADIGATAAVPPDKPARRQTGTDR